MSRWLSILLPSLSLCGPAVAGPASPPDRTARAVFARWLAAFNAADRAAER